MDKAQLARNLKVAREAAGLTQAGVATALGKSRQTIINWESETASPEPDEGELSVLADIYRVSTQDLRYGEVHRAPPVTVSAVVPRHARNLPYEVRKYLAEFQLRLTNANVPEEEIEEAMRLLKSPDVFTYFKGGALSEYNEEDVLNGMRAIGEDVIIPRLKKLGRKVK